jgi:hypothetical protein
MKQYIFIFCALLFYPGSVRAQNVGSIAGDPDFFPISVWMQSHKNALAYKDLGINMFIGIWGGLDREKLDAFRGAGMLVICDQNEFALSNIDDPVIYAWMHDDEPDNAQWNSTTNQYDPCVDPADIIRDYRQIKDNDPSRPVYLNLGQGVAWPNWIGRGECFGDNDSYKISKNGYLKGCDIASFDIYPVNNHDDETSGNLWYVARGIKNLLEWSDHSRPVWCWIETTRINDQSPRKPTPSEVRSQVWMALIHGASGFGYFCHSFTTDPPVDDAAVLRDPEMSSAISEINMQVASLARILNSPSTTGYASVASSDKNIPVAVMTKNDGDADYIFSVAMRPGVTEATFRVADGRRAEVLGENRTIRIRNGKFTDSFSDYGVRLYRITR